MNSPAPYRQICDLLAELCRPAGFDLLQPLQVGWYNRAVSEAYRLPDFSEPSSLAVLVGNTRALWRPFCQALSGDDALATAVAPLDEYTERVLRAAVDGLAVPSVVRFGHQPPPHRVAMQRLAHVAGLAYLAPSHLSVHPVYGPWIALRAVVVIDRPGPPGPAPEPPRPCECEGHCLPFLERALADSQELAQRSVQASWRSWLAIRDACPVGRQHRYGERQIRYHYLHDRDALRPEDG